jgi:hypothetical protein
MSAILLLGLFQLAVSINKNPTEDLLQEGVPDALPKRKYQD